MQPDMSTSGVAWAGTTSARRAAIAANSAAAGPLSTLSARATGRPTSPPWETAGLQRHPPEQRHADLVGESLPASGPEQLVVPTVVARERTHVLDHADDADEAAAGHVGGALGDLLGRQCRRRDDHHVGTRQQAGQPHLHVASARGHVDQQVVELSPLHVAQELLDGLGEHQAAPHQRRVFADEESRGDDLQPAWPDDQLVRSDQRSAVVVVLDRLEPLAHAEQAGDREAPDVGVEHADRASLSSEGDGEVDRDGALADATLAAGDRQHPRRCRDLGVARLLAGVPARLEHHVAALFRRHLTPHDADVANSGVHAESGLDLALDVGADRASADRQLDRSP